MRVSKFAQYDHILRKLCAEGLTCSEISERMDGIISFQDIYNRLKSLGLTSKKEERLEKRPTRVKSSKNYYKPVEQLFFDVPPPVTHAAKVLIGRVNYKGGVVLDGKRISFSKLAEVANPLLEAQGFAKIKVTY